MQQYLKQMDDFSFLRRHFWPIHRHEVKKFLSLTLMMFFILFNYTILRNMKDSLIITTSGPEILPFLKAFVILPFSILIVAFYTKLTNKLPQNTIFYIILSIFLSVYILYTFFLYPNRLALHISPQTLHSWQISYPNFQHFFAIIANWSSTLFYIFAELWGATILGLLFWRLANEITSTGEAVRFYAMFNLITNFAMILAGYIIKCSCSFSKGMDDAWGNVLKYQISLVIITSIIIVGLYYWINKNIVVKIVKKTVPNQSTIPSEKKSLIASFKEIINYKYIRYLAIMVIGYGAVLNITGLVWKKQVLMLFPNPLEYSQIFGDFSILLGVIALIFTLCFKGLIVKIGWYRSAMITPVVVLCSAMIFFLFIFINQYTGIIQSIGGIDILVIIVLIGSAEQILGKSSKYCIFDPTKEMAYIPLKESMRNKGKAAVDVAGYSLGKAGGGYITGILLVFTAASNVMQLTPYLAIIALLLIVIWIMAIKKLSVLYEKKINNNKFDAN